MGILEDTIQKIEAQQPKEHTTVWCCGEQLKDILRAEPHLAELVAQDLENKSMSISKCEEKIKERANEAHGKNGGTSAAVSPSEAEGIIRRFYGLPDRKTQVASPQPQMSAEGVIDLGDFF